MSKVNLEEKMKLAKANRRAKRTPVFATMRSDRKVQTSPKRRHSWRTSKIKKDKN